MPVTLYLMCSEMGSQCSFSLTELKTNKSGGDEMPRACILLQSSECSGEVG